MYAGWTFLLGSALCQRFPEICSAKGQQGLKCLGGQTNTSCPAFNDMVVLQQTQKYFMFLCASVGWARGASRTWYWWMWISMDMSFLIQRADSSGHLSSWTFALQSPGAGDLSRSLHRPQILLRAIAVEKSGFGPC